MQWVLFVQIKRQVKKHPGREQHQVRHEKQEGTYNQFSMIEWKVWSTPVETEKWRQYKGSGQTIKETQNVT